MRQQLPAFALAALCLLLGYRVYSLEQRVEQLDGQLAALEEGAARAPATPAMADGAEPGSSADRPAPPAAATDDPKLQLLAAELERLRDEISTLEQATADKATHEDIDTAVADDRILDVVQRKQAQVRARQLAFQRDRWLGWRKDALADFAQRVQLDSGQQQELLQELEREVDGIAALLRAPGADEDPWATSAKWRELLDATDERARQILAEDQLPAWEHARQTERRILWPWLADR